MEKGLKDIHVTLLPLTMSMRGIAEEENLPTGAPRVGFDYFQHVTVSKGLIEGIPHGSAGKESSCKAGDIANLCSIPRSRRSPREGNDNPLQYSCLENPMDRGAQQAVVHGTAKSWIWLSNYTTINSFKICTNKWNCWTVVCTCLQL